MEGTLAEIRMFAGNFAPRGWHLCNGQLLSIAQNTALFSLLGTTYGGNGQTTFALPDFRGRGPVGTGLGPGLTNKDLGEASGTETATILLAQLPAHNHTATGSVAANQAAATTSNPAGKFPANVQDPTANPISAYADAAGTGPNAANLGTLNITVGTAGGGQPLPIRNPYLGVNFIICHEGIFPSRN